MSGTSWRLPALLPLGEDLTRHLLEPLDADIIVPAVRDRDGLHAALDVYDVYDDEPPPADHPLRHHENVLLSPHRAGATRLARFKRR